MDGARAAAPVRARLALALLGALAAAGCASTDDENETLGIDVYLHNAQGYAEGGHYDQALAEFRRALSIEPSNPKARLGEATSLYWMGTAETSAAGRAILDASEKAEALDPSDYGENSWKVLLVRGLIDARLADLWVRKADLASKNAAEGQAGAEADVAAAREAAARHGAAAESRLREVLSQEDQPLARNNLTALFILASRVALRAKSSADYDEALTLFRRYEKEVDRSKALWTEMKKREPDLADTYEAKLRGAVRQEVELRDLVANIYFKRREHEASIAELDKVIALDGLRASAFFNRGRNHEELGRFGAASDDYRRFLKLTDLQPGSPLVVEAAERMARCEEKMRESMGR
jgi:tetratricopeptide (TPR) repeat protein